MSFYPDHARCRCNPVKAIDVQTETKDVFDIYGNQVPIVSTRSYYCGECKGDIPLERAVLITKKIDGKLEEGDTCPDCYEGKMYLPPVENCSCHIAPPCGQCTSNELACDTCEIPTEAVLKRHKASLRQRLIDEALF